MNRGPLPERGSGLDSYRKDLSVVLSVTVLDVMMNHVDGGSAQRDIRTHLAPSHGGMLVELRRRHHVHTALRRLQERRVHDVRRAIHAYVVDVEQADWHGERRGELLAAAGVGEEIVTAALDFSVLAEVRNSINVFHDRRPELYRL